MATCQITLAVCRTSRRCIDTWRPLNPTRTVLAKCSSGESTCWWRLWASSTHNISWLCAVPSILKLPKCTCKRAKESRCCLCTAEALQPDFFYCREMFQLKSSKLKQQSPFDPHTVAKVNKLISQAVSEYNIFIDLLRDHEKKLPETVDETLVKPYLTARFWIARLYAQFIAATPEIHVLNLRKSAEQYQAIISYCDAHPNLHCFDEELAMCKEMLELLPVKMERAMQGIY
eukprot:m.119234 g.119234  ORF g.119234 m.119234 type:complete len:231 (-) comp19532_c0_seq2:96-788(-)